MSSPCEKLGYKVGDLFEVTSGGTLVFKEGSVIELYRDDGSEAPMFKLVSGSCNYQSKMFVREDGVTEVVRYVDVNGPIRKLPKSTNKQAEDETMKYQFHSLSQSDIDWNRIAQDLTYKNPIAFVDAGAGEQYVVVHDLLIIKSNQFGITIEEDIYTHRCDHYEVYRLFHSTFSDWVEWAKEVKKHPWYDGRKATITVALPKI